MSMPGMIRTFFAWCCKICNRPRTSGKGTATCLSNRPGRVKALSSSLGKFVAPNKICIQFQYDFEARDKKATHDALALRKAVKFSQELIERLAHVLGVSRRSLAAYRVQLVDEDNARRRFPRGSKQFSNTFRSNACRPKHIT